jgi:hypothetical protein
MEQVIRILTFIGDSLIHIWPYLLITIPISVIVKLTDVSKYIKGVTGKRPVISILLATLLGTFSPLCSCGVIPVIASLLLGGVPLAPVMSFWIASPSMDPEIFFLSVSALGWDLAIWRMAATLIISLMAGFITHILEEKGYFGKNYLRVSSSSEAIRFLPSFSEIKFWLVSTFSRKRVLTPVMIKINGNIDVIQNECSCQSPEVAQTEVKETSESDCNSECKPGVCNESGKIPFYKTVFLEIWKSTAMVTKFMALAFLINALIVFYLPADLISGLIASENSFSILIASLAGIPAYTSNIAALPLISGLLKLGMNPAAALSFLIAGPVTTLPAMIAVRGLTSRRIFLLYFSISLFGAILGGYAFQLAFLLK